jgi:hypothetical protein
MAIFDTLELLGITTTQLQIGIFTAIIVVLAGFFWKFIVVGAGILFCVVVFAMPSNKAGTNDAKETTEAKQEVPAEFIEDCKRVAGKTEKQCKVLWAEGINELDEIR